MAMIQRSRWATQSKAKRRVEKGQRSSTPADWQVSIRRWRRAAARAGLNTERGGILFSGERRLRSKKGRVTSSVSGKVKRREWVYVRCQVRKAEGPSQVLTM